MDDVAVMPRTWLRWVLAGIGILVVSGDAISRFLAGHLAVGMFGSTLVAVLAWLALVLVPERFSHVAAVLLAIMVVAGGLATASSSGFAVIPVIVAVIWIARTPSRALWQSILVAAAAILLIFIGGAFGSLSPLALLSVAAGVLVAFLGGHSRRQFLVSEQQARRLVGERARAELLASRQVLAQDIHDVLAHSLGGLVIQLDAVEALLETGATEAAAERVRDARALAAEGLGEARRAVATLRDGPGPSAAARVAGKELVAELDALLEVHLSLGGRVEFTEAGQRRPLDDGLATALRRALQESLTNARKHAPGEPARVHLAWRDGAVELEVSNPLSAVNAPGSRERARSARDAASGHGLAGMRERFATIPGGSATAGEIAGRFVVRVRGGAA